MTKSIALAAAAGSMLLMAAPAVAASDGYKAQSPEIVERNAKGHATKVRVSGVVYDVCMSESQDHCINPRAAGLKWGDRPLGYWPGNRT